MKAMQTKTLWFSYDPGDGFQEHETEQAAKTAAENALQYYRDESIDGWDEEVQNVCWGEIKQRVVEKWRKKRPAPEHLDESGCDKDGNNWQEFNELADYHLQP